jgi:hypothetical protein
MVIIILKRKLNSDKFLQAYITGLALGDGNLSNPNGRAVRLRITCDKKYPQLIDHIKESLHHLLPENRISTANKPGCVDVSVYSNQLTSLIGYQWNGGSKIVQNVGVHDWIKDNSLYSKECLRGLFQTDGSIYLDRGYTMVNFINTGKQLSVDTFHMIQDLGYSPNMQRLYQENGKIKHTIRLAKNSKKFIGEIGLWKK